MSGLIKKTLSTTAALTMLGCVLAAAAAAAPVVLSVSGTADEGEAMSLYGTGFGEGGQIVSWDDFEGGTTGDALAEPPIGPRWSFLHPSDNTPLPYYSADHAWSGNQSAKVVWKEPGWSGYSINAFGWAGQGPYNSLYLTYLRYHDPSQNERPGGMNHKQVYMYGAAGSDLQQWLPFMIPAGTNGWASQLQSQPTRIYYWGGPGYTDTNYSWGRWETWVDYEDVASGTDGRVKMWYNGRLFRDETGQDLCTVSGGNNINDLRIGHMFQGYNELSYVRSFFDDVYISTSQARVELGDAPVFEDCSWREIQIPESWQDGSISFTMRFTRFQQGETAWLFVVDGNGVASPGQAVVVGSAAGGPDLGPPGEPGQPVANN